MSSLFYWAEFWWRVIPLLCRHCFGRRFVFRDCPSWVVAEVAELLTDEVQLDATIHTFVLEARCEISRRRNHD